MQALYLDTAKSASLSSAAMPMVGQKAPEFTLDAAVGKGEFSKVSLAELRGKWVVLVFYPLDFTSVCPTELLELAKRLPEFREQNAAVLGCSIDSIHAHKTWIEGTLGPVGFPLLSDLNREVSRAYGVLIEAAGHATRGTFIIDPEGVLQYALYHNTSIGRSVRETLRVLAALQTCETCPAEWEKGLPTLGK